MERMNRKIINIRHINKTTELYNMIIEQNIQISIKGYYFMKEIMFYKKKFKVYIASEL